MSSHQAVTLWPSQPSPASGASLPCWDAPDRWFAESPADVEAAKASCAPCPLREQCLLGALSRREPWGVWGGELLLAGVVVARKRPRGRPRKHPVPAPDREEEKHEPLHPRAAPAAGA